MLAVSDSEEELLRDELTAQSNRIGFLEEQATHWKEVAERRYRKILDLEEELDDLQEELADLETKIAGRACAGSQNCGFDHE